MALLNESPAAWTGPAGEPATPSTGGRDGGTDSSAATTGPGWSWALAAVVTLAAACIPPLVWPGDTPWMNDEPALVARAYMASQRHELAREGLAGSFGVRYGPMPTQIYQLMLLFTHDPVKLAAARGVLCAGATALGLLWLARSLRLNPWFAAAVLMAPFIWLFERVMWDATFCIPLGTIGLAAYAAFLRREHAAQRESPQAVKRHKPGTRGPLLTALACMLAIPLIHPQSMPLTAAVLGHLVWRHRPALRRHWIGAVLVVVGLIALNRYHLVYSTRTVARGAGWFVKEGHGGRKGSRFVALLTPLGAGRVLAGDEFATVYGTVQGPPALVGVVKVVSAAAIPLYLAGVALVAGREFGLWRLTGQWIGRRRARPGRSDGFPLDHLRHEPGSIPVAVTPTSMDYRVPDRPAAPSGPPTVRDVVLRIALVALGVQMLLYCAVRVPTWLSYFISLFVVYVLFAWVATEALRLIRLRAVVVGLYGASVTVITLATVWHVHHAGWDAAGKPPAMRVKPTLASQVELARALNRYSDETALTDVGLYQQFTQSLWTLRLLVRPEPGQPQVQSGRLLIRFRQDPAGQPDHMEVIELPPGTDGPADAKPIPLTGPSYWPD